MTTNNLIQDQPSMLLDKSLLNRFNQAELEQLFTSLPDIDPGELDGHFRGKIYGLKFLDALPRGVRGLIQTLLNLPLPVWKGKSFTDKQQANIWISFNRPRFFGYYFVVPKDNSHPLQLSYDLEQNPGFLRRVYGEVKSSGNNSFLARMMYGNSDNNLCVLYFTLEPVQ